MNSAQGYGSVEMRAGQQAQDNNPVRLTQVGSEVGRSSDLTDRLFKLTVALNERLGPILRADTSGAQAGPKEPEKPMLVGHALALSNHNDQLEGLASMLGSILDRVEI